MSYHFVKLLQNKIRILVYTGDVDSVCGVMMNRKIFFDAPTFFQSNSCSNSI